VTAVARDCVWRFCGDLVRRRALPASAFSDALVPPPRRILAAVARFLTPLKPA